ncbi:MAG: hypothetical protein M1482_14075 [Chloroflexi bacterium]|nr:hypothetical protein [Chloroflexota bacterium]
MSPGSVSSQHKECERDSAARRSRRARFERGVARLALLAAVVAAGLVIQANPRFVGSTIAATAHVPSAVQPRPAPAQTGALFLPFVYKVAVPPMLLGTYSTVYMGDQATVDQYLLGFDAWAGLDRTWNMGHSIWGDFVSFEVSSPSTTVNTILETTWQNGYTTFVNLSTDTTYTAAQIAAGADDTAITAWAQAYAAWAGQGDHRRAFIAPLQEMNGYWTHNGTTLYGLDPSGYKAAFKHIQNIFAAAGVTRSQVWWTFAPNGYTAPGDPPISSYYPGDAYVDVVAFSAYNFGYCSVNLYPAWETPQQVFGSYITLMRQITSTKPIFIAETGSTAYTATGTTSNSSKSQWLRDAYSYLAGQNIRGVLYFNSDKECDWAVYQPWSGGRQVQGYKDAVSIPAARYFTPASLSVYSLPP